jgi:hypothetical protein
MAETMTGPDGSYSFCDLCTGSGDYRLAEGARSGWVQSWPGSPGYHDFSYNKYTTVTGKDFGNYQSTPGTIVIRKEAAGCLAPPPGMVGWWTGDGNTVDRMDGNDGSLIDGAGYAPGLVDQAFTLDGDKDAVQIYEASAGAPLDGFTRLTLDAWVYPAQVGPGLQTIVSKYYYPPDQSVSNSLSYWLGIIENGQIRFAVYTRNQGTDWSGYYVDTILSDPVITASRWQHVAGVWEGIDGLHIYLNGDEIKDGGVKKVSWNNPGTTMENNGIPVNIGRVEGFNGQPDFFFKGLIDEVEIFDRALSGPEVAAIAHAGSGGKCKHGAVTFPFSGTGGLGSFPLVLGGQKVFENLAPGTYAVTEGVPQGWSLKTIQCSDHTGGTTTYGPTAQISLAGGETVVCTFVNEKCSCNPCGSP